jgi:17beta-estradiol 17-dehydrogenase / very-long-chain 3-oxoacyl-CoA reductase
MLSLLLVALLMLPYALFIIVYWLYTNFYRRDTLSRYLSRETWAIVTGGSDGIGLAMARRLAQRGFNVLVTGRNEEKLKRVVEELRGITMLLMGY